jgi:hypothetical protein
VLSQHQASAAFTKVGTSANFLRHVYGSPDSRSAFGKVRVFSLSFARCAPAVVMNAVSALLQLPGSCLQSRCVKMTDACLIVGEEENMYKISPAAKMETVTGRQTCP